MLDNNAFLATYIQIVLNIVFYLLIIINKHVLVYLFDALFVYSLINVYM